MSRLREIEDYVKRLYETVETKLDGQEADHLAKDLTDSLGSSLQDKNMDYTLSTSFNSEYGLIRFLSKTATNKDKSICSAVSTLLRFLVEFIPRQRKHTTTLQLYVLDLKIQCLRIASSGSAVTRADAIYLLIALIDKNNRFDTSAFDIPDLYKRFLDMSIAPKTSLPGGVKGRVLEILGKIARCYPDIPGTAGFNMLKRRCFTELTHQLNASSTEDQIVAGCLFCLDNILYRDEADMTGEIDNLFHILCKIFIKYRDAKRYAAIQAALTLFTNHTAMFSELLTLPNQWKELFVILEMWASHHNPTTYKIGLAAFENYIKQLSAVLHLNYGGELEQQIFNFVMQKFDQQLEKAHNLENFFKVCVAIRGVGYFAKVCAKLLPLEEMNEKCNKLVKISDWFYANANADQKDYLRHIPAFIKAYTMFAAEMDPIPVDLMETLHNMCNIFIMGFINMTGYHRRSGVYNMRSLFGMLHQKGEGLFRNFLNSLFEKALTCTCTEITEKYADDRPAYNDLLYFWKVILDNPFDNQVHIKVEPSQKSISSIKAEGVNEEEEEEEQDEVYYYYRDKAVPEPANLADTLYDSFLLAIMKLTKTFNLKLITVAEEADVDHDSDKPFNTITTTLKPANQKDFILFQNLVDFWCLVLKEIENRRLADWVYIVGTAIIDQSVLNPLVSGFYRMMAEMMIVCEKRNFFVDCKQYHHYSDIEHGSEKYQRPAEYATYLIFREYLKEIWHRLHQFTDELLASCLRLILAYPIAFFDVDELIIPLEKALKLGITYHPLATIAMNSLDKLLELDIEAGISSEFLSQILPCINEYLLVGINQESEDALTLSQYKYRAGTATQRRYEKVHIKMTPDQLGVAKSEYSALSDLQLRMLQFLGRLGGKNKQLLLQGNKSIQTNDMLAWDPVKRLKLHVPFKNSKVDIYLDEFLPRICELAESSPDRHVKVAACELLHSLALFMIGNAAFAAKDTRETMESDYHKLYLRIFPVMLRLAIDPDQVARDMFRLLYAQLIHWLTNNAHSENPETMALLQTCLDAACSKDAGLREYGAECIQEFVKWSIKQTSRSTDGAMNIKSLLKRLYNLMSNPNSTKRLGASLVFNHIYRLFREEPVLVNEYTLEILGQLFLSLKIAEADHPSIGTRDQTIEAISHIKRILRAKSADFLIENTSRRSFIGSEDVIDLPSVVEWTFIESGKVQRTYAKVCLDFFVEFVVLLPGVNSAKSWLLKALSNNAGFYIDVFETDRLAVPMTIDDDNRALLTYTNWIKRVNSAVDGYIWLIEREVLDPYDLITNVDSQLLIALQSLITRTPFEVLEEKLNHSIMKKTKILSIYSHVSVRLIYFLHLVSTSKKNGEKCFQYLDKMSSDVLYNKDFTDLIARTLLLPKKTSEFIQSDQGNAVTNSGVTRIYNIAKDYIIAMHKMVPSRFMPCLTKSIAKVIHEEDVNLLLTTDFSSERSKLIDIIQTVDGIKLLQSIDGLQMICKELHKLDRRIPDDADEYCELLFDQFLLRGAPVQEPLFIQLLGRSVTVAFAQKGFPEKHASDLLGFSGRLESLETHEKLNLYQKYREYIFACMANYFYAFSPVLGNNVDSPLARDYLPMFLEYLKANRHNQRKLVFCFSDNLVGDPDFLKLLVEHSTSEDQLLDLIISLKQLFGADPGILSRSKKKPIFGILWDAFLSFFKQGSSFLVKKNALDLLPVYISFDQEHVNVIIDKLNESIVANFPIETSSLEKGSTFYNEYITYLDKLLETMATFKSVGIFNILIGTFIQEEHHIHEETIKKYFKEFTTGLGLRTFTEVVERCFQELKDEENSNLQRHNLSEMIISLTAGTDDRAVVAFYEKNIEYILATIQREPAMSPSKQIKDWSEKSDCLNLVQNLFDKLPEDFFTADNVIYEKWIKSPLNTTKKKLTGVIIKANADLRKTATLGDSSFIGDTRRKTQLLYNRSTVNCLLAMMICIAKTTGQTDSIFKEDEFGRYNWDYVIDTKQEIRLGIQWDQPLAKSKLNELRALSGYSSEKNETNIHYMASIALTGSSLSQTSLSEAVLENQTDPDTSAEKGTTATPSQDGDTEMTEAEKTILSYGEDADEFEHDLLNENSFMKPLTEIVKKLHEEIIKPEAHPVDAPLWIKKLLKSFKNSGDQINIQIYIAKLICNYPFAFAPYAESWYLPLMELITKGKLFGCPINYLVQDVCNIMNIWGKDHKLPSPRSSSTARILYEFADYLIKYAFHNNQLIMRSNVQIIKGVFENWGEFIPIPTQTLYNQFTHKGEDEPRNIIGLQVLSIVFLNNRNPYDARFLEMSTFSEKAFYLAMASNVFYRNARRRDISADAAELMGMTIDYMRKDGNPLLDELYDNFKSQLVKISTSSHYSKLRFLKCMNRVRLRDVKLARELMSVVSFNLRQYANAEKLLAMEYLAVCWEDDDMIFHTLEGAGLGRMISDRDEKMQIAVLKVLNKIFPILKEVDIKKVIKRISKAFSAHQNEECRALYYAFLKKAFTALKSYEDLQDLKGHLFQGLIDKEKSIVSEMYAFVENIFDINDNIYEAVKKITRDLYMPKRENIYVLYATCLVLNNTKKSFDFNQPIFDKPLPNAKFDGAPQHINTSWSTTSSMLPLFKPTQTQVIDFDNLEVELKRTQSTLDFSITQGADRTLVSTFNPDKDQPDDEDGGDTEDEQKPTSKNSVKVVYNQNPYALKRKRFNTVAPGASNRFHSARNERLQKRMQHLKNTFQENLEKKVSLTRSYRFGELPDVQINFKDLLLPLEVLASKDYNISRLLYSSLVVGIVKTNKSEDIHYERTVVGNIQRNIDDSILNFTPTIGSFLRIFFDLDTTDQPVSMVRKASSKSSNQHIGISLLEKQLDLLSVAPNVGKRKHPYEDGSDDEVIISPKDAEKKRHLWIDLGLLYKEIDEPEIFQSLYLNNVLANSSAALAINYEIRGEYAYAFNQYKKASVENSKTSYEANVWTEEMLFCYSQLCFWDKIEAKVIQDVGEDVLNRIWDEKNKNTYLKYFVRSLSRESTMPINTGNESAQIIQFYKEAAEDEDRKNFLLQNYANEWSSVSLLQKQYDLSFQVIQSSYDSLLKSWTTLHPLAHTSRLSKLSQLQRTVEIEDYLKLLKKLKQNVATSHQVEKFFETLMIRYPHEKSDTIDVWDDLIDTRTIFIKDLLAQDLRVAKNELQGINKYQVKFTNTLADTAIKQGNSNVGLLMMKHLSALGADSEAQLCKIQVARLLFETNSKNKHAELLSNSIKQEVTFQAHYTDLADKFRSKIILASAYEQAKNKLLQNPNLFDEMVKTASLKQAFKDNMAVIANADIFINYLETVGFDKLIEAGESIDKASTQYTEYIWKLGSYCDGSLHSLEDSTSTLQMDIDPTQYCKLIVKYYIDALDRGHREAIDNFPRILDLLEQYPDCGPIFQESIDNLDTIWRLIRWIPQLISFIETPVAPYVLSALTKIAESYPNAIYYHFQMYFEHYELKRDSIPKENREYIEKIRAKIRSPIMEEFTLELQRLTNPEHLLKDFTEVIKTIIVGQHPPASFIDSVYNQIDQLLLNAYSSRMGEIPKSFSAKNRKKIEDTLGRKGANLHKLTPSLVGKLDSLLTDINNSAVPSKKPVVLKSYAPWLASFKSSEFDEELEIPGQYDGLTKPYPELHAKVASFNGTVLVMESIRKPKKIIIHGSDEKDYSFLVKGGEDLRLDQRIEQLFTVMNGMLRRNAFCSKQNIQIATYKVVPMSLNLGIIEWVDNTRPLKSCLNRDQRTNRKLIQAQQSYHNWVLRTSSSRKLTANCFARLYAEDRSNTVKNYDKIIENIPSTLLRDKILELSASPEAFIFMRKRFAYSLACISIFGYVLGIGDRHLENFLLNMKSGLLIPIDFGHAFGTATEMLPVPELVPFRLTPQLVGVLDPLGISGILENPMVTIMKAIQNERKLLLNIMSVFIKDPLLDWKKAAIKQQAVQKGPTGSSGDSSTTTDSSQIISWYPQKKLETVKRKLNGDNPTEIVQTELYNGHSKRTFFKDITSMAKGNPKYDIRARVGSTCEDTNQQIKCLINLATDKRVLGVMWSGWQPYL